MLDLTMVDGGRLEGVFTWEDANNGRLWGTVEVDGDFDSASRRAELRVRRWIDRGGGSYYGSTIKFSESYDSFQAEHNRLPQCGATYRKKITR
jgi:hypothetical protein